MRDNIIEIPPGYLFHRGAWNPASIWPRHVTRTYRFGPPDALRSPDGRYPFHWVYAADHVITAAWEARFCVNDPTRPGTFFIDPNASDALMASLRFDQPVRLLDLTGTAVSKLGLYDELRSPDHEWCSWFGVLLDQLIVAGHGAIHGFRYPSRRHPGCDAYAISSRVMDALAPSLSHSARAFRETVEFAELVKDACCVPPP